MTQRRFDFECKHCGKPFDKVTAVLTTNECIYCRAPVLSPERWAAARVLGRLLGQADSREGIVHLILEQEHGRSPHL